MASNYTTNYQLPIWAAEDSFLRTEFNDAMGKIETAIDGAAEKKPYVTGSYTGNGGAGSYEPNHLEFGFVPSLVVIVGGGSDNTATSGLFFYPATVGQLSNSQAFVTWTETGMSWYASSHAVQLNSSGKKYYYIAFR